jgi:hypothetical protein
MKQQTLAVAADQAAGFERHHRSTRRVFGVDGASCVVGCAMRGDRPYYPKRGRGPASGCRDDSHDRHDCSHYRSKSNKKSRAENNGTWPDVDS